jgi:hypothetical protein
MPKDFSCYLPETYLFVPQKDQGLRQRLPQAVIQDHAVLVQQVHDLLWEGGQVLGVADRHLYNAQTQN